MSTDVVIIERPDLPDKITFTMNPIAIQAVKEKYPAKDSPKDLSTKEAQQKNTEARRAFVKARGSITNEHRDFKAPVLSFTQSLDAAKREGIANLKEDEDVWVADWKAWQEKLEIERREKERLEEERVERINGSINAMRGLLLQCIDSNSADIYKVVEALRAQDLSSWADEHLEAAEQVKAESLAALESHFERAEAFELIAEQRKKDEAEREAKDAAAAAELKELKAKEEEQRQKEIAELKAKDAAREAELAAARAEVEKERQKQREEHKAEMVRLRAEKEKADQKAAEKRKAEDAAETERLAAKKAAKDKEMLEVYKAEAITDMAYEYAFAEAKLSEEEMEALGELLIKAIIDGKIRHVAWV